MSKPSPREAREYAITCLNYRLNGKAFVDYYDVKGWTDDWRSAVRSWSRQSKVSDDPKYAELVGESKEEKEERCIRHGTCPSCYSRITNSWDDARNRCEGCFREYK